MIAMGIVITLFPASQKDSAVCKYQQLKSNKITGLFKGIYSTFCKDIF